MPDMLKATAIKISQSHKSNYKVLKNKWVNFEHYIIWEEFGKRENYLYDI